MCTLDLSYLLDYEYHLIMQSMSESYCETSANIFYVLPKYVETANDRDKRYWKSIYVRKINHGPSSLSYLIMQSTYILKYAFIEAYLAFVGS